MADVGFQVVNSLKRTTKVIADLVCRIAFISPGDEDPANPCAMMALKVLAKRWNSGCSAGLSWRCCQLAIETHYAKWHQTGRGAWFQASVAGTSEKKTANCFLNCVSLTTVTSGWHIRLTPAVAFSEMAFTFSFK